jgi:UDP-N-acetylmuramate dehydrogenase
MPDFLPNIPLADKNTYRIGGAARWYCEPVDAREVAEALVHARKESLPVLVIGKGSNILISDRGWPGLAINLAAKMTSIDWDGFIATAQAGATLDRVAREAVHRGLAGMEELSGIPGTVGGAVVMNAGAFSTCIADTIIDAVYLDMSDYAIVKVTKEELGLGYRSSILQKKEAIVLSAKFQFKPGDPEKLKAVRSEIFDKRKQKQPLDLPNCGSVFKRPLGNYAGALIEQAGLRGMRYGNAEISSKHANFIVNHGGATAAEVRHLIVLAQRTVYEKTGILLEPEVVFTGEFEERLLKKE